MGTALSIVGTLIFIAVCLASLVSLIFGFPGTFIIAAANLIYAWLTGFATIEFATCLWLLGLATVGEVLDFAITAAAASTGAGQPSRRVTVGTIAGAFIGGIVGTPFLFGIGSLFGALAGAFLGAALAVSTGGGTMSESLESGFAALRGKLLGFVLKSGIGVTMILIIAAALIR